MKGLRKEFEEYQGLFGQGRHISFRVV